MPVTHHWGHGRLHAAAWPCRCHSGSRQAAIRAGPAQPGNASTEQPVHVAQASSRTTTTTTTPLLDAVMERASRVRDAPFHVPGHKKGQGVHSRFRDMMDAGVLKHDLTEISGLDYLASPSGVIQEAQALASRTFSSSHTWLLVNGSSGGIHAAIMSVTGPGDTLMVARNCHQSAFAGMVLSGCSPWWLQPEVDSHPGVAHCVTPVTLSRELDTARAAGRKVAGVLVVSPTYFGTCADVAGLAQVCHAAGVPLIVDEAHGAHLGLHPALPPSAMQQGADLSIQSTHKVLSAMTQASMLHVAGGRVDRTRVSRALQMLQTSSPSYVLMASLDAARAHADQPEECFGEALQAAQVAQAGLSRIPGISLLHYTPPSSSTPCPAHHPGQAVWQDPLRLTVCVSGLGLSGYQASEVLEQHHGVVAELATDKVVVFALGPGSTVAHAQQLVQGLQALSTLSEAAAAGSLQQSQQGNGHASSGNQAPLASTTSPPAQPEQRMSPRDAFFTKSERVAYEHAAGRVSSELLCPYPPGVPVLYPGEVITAEALTVLRAALEAGGKVTGASDGTLQTILVCC